MIQQTSNFNLIDVILEPLKSDLEYTILGVCHLLHVFAPLKIKRYADRWSAWNNW
jgi:hypothetical protein